MVARLTSVPSPPSTFPAGVVEIISWRSEFIEAWDSGPLHPAILDKKFISESD